MAKTVTPNPAQTTILTAAVANEGTLPTGTPNEVRTAQACERRGWATEVGPKQYEITATGREAVNAEPAIEPVDEPETFNAEDVESRGTEVQGEPVDEAAEQAYSAAAEAERIVKEAAEVPSLSTATVVTGTTTAAGLDKPGKMVFATKGTRVYHVEKIVGGCTGDDHRRGLMTGQHRLTQGRVHAEVQLDCGHTRWPLLRVLIVEGLPESWERQFTAVLVGGGAVPANIHQLATEYHALGLDVSEAVRWAEAGFTPLDAFKAISNGYRDPKLVPANFAA